MRDASNDGVTTRYSKPRMVQHTKGPIIQTKNPKGPKSEFTTTRHDSHRGGEIEPGWMAAKLLRLILAVISLAFDTQPDDDDFSLRPGEDRCESIVPEYT